MQNVTVLVKIDLGIVEGWALEAIVDRVYQKLESAKDLAAIDADAVRATFPIAEVKARSLG